MRLSGQFLRGYVVWAVFLALVTLPVSAVAGTLPPMVRDAEIEVMLDALARPVLLAATLEPDSVRIRMLNSREINAFVAGGQNIYLYTGLLLDARNPQELLGVIAHETGHIAGGHLSRTHDVIEKATASSLVATLIGVAAAVAVGAPEAGIAVFGAGQQVATGQVMGYSRAQESAADQAALRYLREVGETPRGLYDFLARLSAQELLPTSQQDEYMRTHPLTRDRMQAVAHASDQAGEGQHAVTASMGEAYDRMQAKLLGFLQPRVALRQYRMAETMAERYGCAIARYRLGDIQLALKELDALLVIEPDNPYFHELRGQILFENGRITEAVPSYQRAVALDPRAGLIRMALGHALLETLNPTVLDEAITHLGFALRQEPRAAQLHRWLATAWGRKGQIGLARLHLAEASLLTGNPIKARVLVQSAQAYFSVHSPAAQRAQDILRAVDAMERDQP